MRLLKSLLREQQQHTESRSDKKTSGFEANQRQVYGRIIYTDPIIFISKTPQSRAVQVIATMRHMPHELIHGRRTCFRRWTFINSLQKTEKKNLEILDIEYR